MKKLFILLSAAGLISAGHALAQTSMAKCDNSEPVVFAFAPSYE